MIVYTPYGDTDSTTGEILDLAPLRKSPPKPTRRRLTRSKRKSDPLADSVWFVGLLGLLIGVVGLSN